jgi:hypothetical protein
MKGIILAHCDHCGITTPSRLLDTDYKVSAYFLQITKCLDCQQVTLMNLDLTENRKGGNHDPFHASLN